MQRSNHPGGACSPSALPPAVTTTTTTTERLAFSIQLKRLVIDAPLKLPLHHSVYVKWQRGKFFRGKLSPVPCPAQAHPRLHKPDGRSQVEIELPPGHQIQFEVNVHSRFFQEDRKAAPQVTSTLRTGGARSAENSPVISMEKKTLDIEIYYLRYEDHTRVDLKARSLVARVNIDIRDWLKDARVGRSCTFLCPFEGMSLIDGMFVVSPVKASSNSSKTTVAHSTIMSGDLDDVDGSTPLALEDIDFPFAPLGTTGPTAGGDQVAPRVPQRARGGGASNDAGGETTVLIDAAQLLSSFGGQRDARAIVENIMEDGLFRAVTINNPSACGGVTSSSNAASMVVATVFDRLFSDRHGRLGTALHAARGDQSYDGKKPFEYIYNSQQRQPEQFQNHAMHNSGHVHPRHLGPPTPAASAAASTRYAVGGCKTIPFRLRISKDKFVDAIENTVVCYLRGDIVVHLSVTAPTAPIVGDNLRLETLIHITANVASAAEDQAGGGGIAPACTIAMYTHVVVASSKIKFMFGSKIQHHAEKISILLESVTKQLTAVNKGSGALRPLRGSARFRNSFNPSASSASLDPNLWRRLGDEHTLPHAELVLLTMKRLAPVVPQLRQTSATHIQTLENVIGFHRQDAVVVTTALQLILLLVKAGGGVTNVAHASNTLVSTIRSVQLLHPTATFDFAEMTLRQLEISTAALREQRQREAAGVARNLWVSLQSYMGDADIVQHILDRIQSSAAGGSRGLSNIWADGTSDTSKSDKFRILAALLSLHTQSLRICEAICHLMSAARDFLDIPLDQNILVALRTAYRVHHPVLGEHCPHLLQRIEESAEGTMTTFQKVFGAVVPEAPVFECLVVVEAPSWRAGKMYVTRSFLCVIDEVVPLANIRRIELYRSLLRPAVRVFMIATVPDYELVLLSRAQFLEALNGVGCGWMIRNDNE